VLKAISESYVSKYNSLASYGRQDFTRRTVDEVSVSKCQLLSASQVETDLELELGGLKPSTSSNNIYLAGLCTESVCESLKRTQFHWPKMFFGYLPRYIR
jgi:hypothetical protein